MPVFKDATTYADTKISILRADFCVQVSDEEEVYIRQFTTEHEIDAACLTILNRHWE